jgi:RNA polymerase sigma-70 factor (ECF subfamily)
MAPATPSCLRDPSGFASLYSEHAPAVRQAALAVSSDSTLADDVTQEVFLQVWLHPERWQPERGELGLYLRILARSRTLDAMRASGAARRAHERLKGATVGEHVDSDASSAVVHRCAVRAAVAELPHAQREAVALAFWAGLTANEIAHRSALPLGTVKSRVRLGLEKLRSQTLIQNA